jgi:TolB protein
LYLINSDGSEIRRLAGTPGIFHAPSWAPDGKQITFSISGEEKADIVVLNMETLEIKNLTHQSISTREGVGDITPAWSPDGKHIAFASDRDQQTGVFKLDIYVMNVDGSNIQRMTEEPYSAVNPAWFPDGTKIAFTCDCAAICIINADGSGRTKLIDPTLNFEGGTNPTWSPDGWWIAFESNRELDDAIYIMSLDGLRTIRLTNEHDVLFAEEPDWQPQSLSP